MICHFYPHSLATENEKNLGCIYLHQINDTVNVTAHICKSDRSPVYLRLSVLCTSQCSSHLPFVMNAGSFFTSQVVRALTLICLVLGAER